MSTVSVVIPNFNGQTLLAKHLPAVLRSMRTGDELVVIDDCSTDDSWEWLKKQFSTQAKKTDKESYFSQDSFDGLIERGKWSSGQKTGSVLLLQNRLNQRFAKSCNRAVELASSPLIFLLNSDVSPHPKTIQSLVKHFEDSSVFAVGCLEHEKDLQGNNVLGGKNTLRFGRGMFAHQRANSFESGETAWASGGSSMFDRSKWLALQGFDPDYYPAYWEDVDLSQRAKKRGWTVLFDAEAEVDHNHESTNTSAFGPKKMTKMSWQHAQTFVAKNGTWQQKLQYLLWQPYWWIKGPTIAPLQLQLIILALIILVAAALRFYKLAEVPHGMTWDEAAIAYNGWSVTTTGRDEWLKKLPISFRSFGDYKAPLAIYIVGAFTRVFGLSLLAVRLPFALSGVAAVMGMMLLTKLLWQLWIKKGTAKVFPILDSNTAALLAGTLMAVSPWHVHFSRIGFESGMALNFLLWGVSAVVWLIAYSSSMTTKWQRLFCGAVGLFGAISLASSLYTYHSSKIVTPLVLAALAVFFLKPLLKSWKNVVVWGVLLGLLLVPLAVDSLFGNGADRFQQSTVFRLGLSPLELLSTLIQHFLAHFTPAYLVHGQTETLRHGDGQFGVLYLTEFFLVVVALLGSVYQWMKKKSAMASLPLFTFSLLWVLIGVVPAVIGVDVPHSNRMLLALPGFLWLALLGWDWIAQNFKDGLVAPAILGITLLLQIFLVSSYLNNYYTVFAKTSSDAFVDGYTEAVQYAVQYEPDVDQILFTSTYQQPYIYTLIGRGTNTYQYHNGALIKYLFTDTINNGDIFRPKTLIIATPEQVDPRAGTHLVFGSDGNVKFVIVKTHD